MLDQELFIAHIKPNNNGWDKPQKLEDHLYGVSYLASSFAKDDDMKEWLKVIGCLHDFGKYSSEFQVYIRDNAKFTENLDLFIIHTKGKIPKKVDHSTAGAIHAIKILPPNGIGILAAYIIAGHHSGLQDWDNLEGNSRLKLRLEHGEDKYKKAIEQNVSSCILQIQSNLFFPKYIREGINVLALWVRIAFSCLVDADFLDTEAYMDPEKFKNRQKNISLEQLWTEYDKYMKSLSNNVSASLVQIKRSEILQLALNAAEQEPGVFSFTVPTGGGKTLATLGFALKHAIKYHKKRVIYAIPYTSIIEQTADVFRKVFKELGNDIVLEHHCNLDADLKDDDFRKLATENWEAPLIVTTNIQLFESLHASRTSKCRKIHNIQDSVIILDEAQQIPRDFHAPITRTMDYLTKYFGVTFVLCTATQPVLTKVSDSFGKIVFSGLNDIREIIDDPISLANDLRRTRIIFDDLDKPKSWEEIADKVLSEDCVLCIVNTRRDASDLFKLLPDNDENFHLSASMCAQHRSDVIKKIRDRLKARREGDNKPLRVISTQLVEAGVDLDFPTVFRALAGLDSIAQAAGRCNREGKMKDFGKVWVFNTESDQPKGLIRQGAEETISLLSTDPKLDVLSPQAFNSYFKGLNNRGNRDAHNICGLLRPEPDPDFYVPGIKISFKDAAEKFRMIDDNGISIVVPYIKNNEEKSSVFQWIAMLESKDVGLVKKAYRKLQRYTVSVREELAKSYEEQGAIEDHNGVWVALAYNYDLKLGLKETESLLSPEQSVC